MKHTDIRVSTGEYRIVPAKTGQNLLAIGIEGEILFTIHNGEEVALARNLTPDKIHALFQEMGTDKDTKINVINASQNDVALLLTELSKIDKGTNKLAITTYSPTEFRSISYDPKTNRISPLQVTYAENISADFKSR